MTVPATLIEGRNKAIDLYVKTAKRAMLTHFHFYASTGISN